MARTIGEQVYEDQVASGQIQLPNVLPQDYGYTGLIEDESEFDTPYGTKTGIGGYYDRFTGPIKNIFQQYGRPIMGGLMSAVTGIPGLSFLMRNLPNDPYAQNRIDMYGAYRGNDGFIKDKFGYNVGNTLLKNNFMQPGSNSFRSYALEGLRGLDENVANRYYQETYGRSFEDIKKDIQKKKDPFNQQNVFAGTSDYQGGGGGGGASPGSEGPGGSDEMGSFRKGGLASL
jgi:hypothetical protein